MIDYENLKALAIARLDEGKCLLANGFHDGAVYLFGYVVELALKARVCKVLNLTQYPDSGKLKQLFSTHVFDVLVVLGGLSEEPALRKDVPTTGFYEKWSLATKWKPEYRYNRIGSVSKEEAESVLTALTDPAEGVLSWLQKIW
jgi:hypothetical protein